MKDELKAFLRDMQQVAREARGPVIAAWLGYGVVGCAVVLIWAQITLALVGRSTIFGSNLGIAAGHVVVAVLLIYALAARPFLSTAQALRQAGRFWFGALALGLLILLSFHVVRTAGGAFLLQFAWLFFKTMVLFAALAALIVVAEAARSGKALQAAQVATRVSAVFQEKFIVLALLAAALALFTWILLVITLQIPGGYARVVIVYFLFHPPILILSCLGMLVAVGTEQAEPEAAEI